MKTAHELNYAVTVAIINAESAQRDARAAWQRVVECEEALAKSTAVGIEDVDRDIGRRGAALAKRMVTILSLGSAASRDEFLAAMGDADIGY